MCDSTCECDCRDTKAPVVVNTTPHEVVVMGKSGLVRFPPDPTKAIRCEMSMVQGASFMDCDVKRAGSYYLAESPDWAKDVDAIIVSTIVAGAAVQLRGLNPKLRILVPDSGPSAVRDEKGRILHVVRFLEY